MSNAKPNKWNFTVGEVYNVDFFPSGGYSLFLKYLTYDGEYITTDYQTLHVFKNEDNDLISISDRKIKNSYVEQRKTQKK